MTVLGVRGFRVVGPQCVQMVEILPGHFIRSYEDCRRDGKSRSLCGVKLVIAPAGYSSPTDD